MPKSPHRALLVGALSSVAVAVLWTGLAALNPTTNYHLSPLVAVLAAPAVARMANSARLPFPMAAITVAIGVALAAIAAAVIAAAGWAHGPTFTSSLTALEELLGAIAIGMALGVIVAFMPVSAHQNPQNGLESEATIRKSSSTDH